MRNLYPVGRLACPEPPDSDHRADRPGHEMRQRTVHRGWNERLWRKPLCNSFSLIPPLAREVKDILRYALLAPFTELLRTVLLPALRVTMGKVRSSNAWKFKSLRISGIGPTGGAVRRVWVGIRCPAPGLDLLHNIRIRPVQAWEKIKDIPTHCLSRVPDPPTTHISTAHAPTQCARTARAPTSPESSFLPTRTRPPLTDRSRLPKQPCRLEEPRPRNELLRPAIHQPSSRPARPRCCRSTD